MSSTLKSITSQHALLASILNANPNLAGSQSINDTTQNQVPIGSAAGSADGLITGLVNVVSGTPLLIDLTNPTASGFDRFGVAAPAGHLVGIKITNQSTTPTDIITLGGGTNAILATQSLTIGLGASFEWDDFVTGGLLISSTTKIIQLVAAAGTIPVSISLVTRSA